MKSAQSVLASRGRGVMLVSVDFERLRDPGVALLSRCSCPGRAAQGPSSGLWVPPKLRFGAPPFTTTAMFAVQNYWIVHFPPSFFLSCFQDFHNLFRNPSCGFLCCELTLTLVPLLRMPEIFCVA
ncbi:hypothetical protein QR685DRAFT_257748 [Neurospora intermedia]|uniref:Uncharacterized protein n=1 Tax=Neurospora intermedia TaxID=5142 RepID=A0ABR3DD21_NEUIN